jgi:uncharacterized protein (DUF1015 family)
VHKIWRIDAPEILESIEAKMADEKIFIADGHHRFEVACAYREEMQKKLGKTTGEEKFNYILTYFTNIESLGLTILPIHRLVRLNAPPEMGTIIEQLKELFFVEEVKDKTRFLFLLEKAGRTEHLIGMYHQRKFWLVRLRNVKTLDKMIADKPREYRSLDVSILNYLILKNILKLDVEDKDTVRFNPSAEELIEQVNNDTSLIAFFLNPTKVQQIVEVALGGNKMPPKSTYFYPKVLSGLVINKHDDT